MNPGITVSQMRAHVGQVKSTLPGYLRCPVCNGNLTVIATVNEGWRLGCGCCNLKGKCPHVKATVVLPVA